MTRELNRLIEDALAIEAEEARSAGALGFMCRAMTLATMPHKKPQESVYERHNGAFTLTMMANPTIGLPYGTKPRLLMSWVTTEAVRTRERQLVLGNSLSAFMRELGLVPTGGRWGSITALRDQTKRLFSCSMSATYDTKKSFVGRNFSIAADYELWWTPRTPEQRTLWQSTVTLGEHFWQEVITNPVPLDMRALKALSRSPMALDIYVWLTYRLSYLKKPTIIPWALLRTQFGADYADTPQGARDFKRGFVLQLRKVLVVYPDAVVGELSEGLCLSPSRPHVRKLDRLPRRRRSG